MFSYKGDLYKVATKGGVAAPLTLHAAHDYKPVWSRDGKHIAFASNRYGNFDIFLIAAEGGQPRRLTYHSADDFPSDFNPTNDEIIFLENICPSLSVEVRTLSLKDILFFEFLIALPLNIKCGKSISHSCGGT